MFDFKYNLLENRDMFCYHYGPSKTSTDLNEYQNVHVYLLIECMN